MRTQQLVWPEGDVWLGRSDGGFAYRVGLRRGKAPAGTVYALLGPRAAGGPVLWLDARGTVCGLRGDTPLRGVALAAGDPYLLVAASDRGVLSLMSEQACTSVVLPAPPTAMAALGAAPGHPALCLVALPDGVSSLTWQDNHVARQELAHGAAREVVLLAGEPAAAAVRLAGGELDRLLLFLHRSVPWTGWQPLPPLLLDSDETLRLRQVEQGLYVRVGQGAWLLQRDGQWHEAALVDPVGVTTQRYGRFGSRDLEAWPEKEHLPSAGKLAVGRNRQGIPVPSGPENASQRPGDFVRMPRGV